MVCDVDPVSLGSIQYITKARQTIVAKALEKDKTAAAETSIGPNQRGFLARCF